MFNARRILTASCLVATLLSALRPVPAAEEEGLPEEVVAIARFHRFFETAQRWAAVADDLHLPPEAAKTLPMAIGRFLRNPELHGVSAKGFIEIAVFAPAALAGSPVAIALAVDDAAEYRGLIAKRPTVQEESAADEIAIYRDSSDEGAVSFYLATPVGNRLVVCGHSAATVRKARDLYLRRGPQGILADRPGQLTLHISPQRLIDGNRQRLEQELATLREDLLAALAGPQVNSDHPLGRGIAYWLAGMLSWLEQVSLLEINAALDTDKLSVSCAATLAPGSLSEILAEASNEPLRLQRLKPRGCADWQDMTLSGSLLRSAAAAAADFLLIATEGMAGQDLRAEARALLAAAEAAGPREMLAFSLADDGESAPASFRLVRWQRPELVPPLIDRLDRLCAAGGEWEKLLAGRGLAWEWRRERRSYQAGGESADILRFALKPAPAFANSLAPLSKEREIILACRGNYLAAAAGPGARQRWPQIMAILGRTEASVEPALPEARDAAGVFCLGALWPRRYVEMALALAMADDTAPPARAPVETEEEEPFISEWRYVAGKVICRLRLPRRTIYDLARLCLGLPALAD